jgi:hypothetical protein
MQSESHKAARASRGVQGRRRTTAVQQHVVGLEVAMQHSLTVNELQSANDLQSDANLKYVRRAQCHVR